MKKNSKLAKKIPVQIAGILQTAGRKILLESVFQSGVANVRF
jgi:hypothetical protein